MAQSRLFSNQRVGGKIGPHLYSAPCFCPFNTFGLSAKKSARPPCSLVTRCGHLFGGLDFFFFFLLQRQLSRGERLLARTVFRDKQRKNAASLLHCSREAKWVISIKQDLL